MRGSGLASWIWRSRTGTLPRHRRGLPIIRARRSRVAGFCLSDRRCRAGVRGSRRADRAAVDGSEHHIGVRRRRHLRPRLFRRHVRILRDLRDPRFRAKPRKARARHTGDPIDGSGVNFRASLVRNLLRVLYVIPLFYLVDAWLILATKRNQRLGDLLAGTLVVRDRIGAVTSMSGGNWGDPRLWSRQWRISPWAPLALPGSRGHPNREPREDLPVGTPQGGTPQWGPPGAQPWGAPNPGWCPPSSASWDVTAVTPADLVVVQTFLSRRFQYDPHARGRLAEDLAGRLWPKVAGLSPHGTRTVLGGSGSREVLKGLIVLAVTGLTSRIANRRYALASSPTASLLPWHCARTSAPCVASPGGNPS